jgi:dTDP-4-dehydrorhamnose reductase
VKILLFGGSGQVGWQLRRSLSLLGDLVVAERNGSPCGDLLQPGALHDGILSARPDIVVNAAAYTAVDRAEDEPELAFAANAQACEAMAQASGKTGAWMVHYSSDYVYRGNGTRPWLESDACEPLGVYGRSKLAGDLAIMRGNARHLILRTSWVFDSWGGNFLKSILKAAREREDLAVVCDQWGAPTRAATIADVTALALARILQGGAGAPQAGVYHVAASGETNWHDYACLLIAEARASGMRLRATPQSVRATPASQYAARAARPANSRLDTARLRSTFGVQLPPWQDGVRAVVAELVQASRFGAS